MKTRNSHKRKKARNVLQGVELGAKSLFTGITDGIAGVVMQPIRGTKKEGAIGFFKGVAKGLSGLVMKPVSGVLDTVSKTAEGIQNTTRGAKVAKVERARLPRAFYNYDQSIKPYSHDDATYYGSLKLSTSRKDELIVGYNNLQRQGVLCYLALTTQYITILDEKSNVTHFDLSKLLKVTRPDVDLICLEYQGKKVVVSLLQNVDRVYLDVLEGKHSAEAIVKDLHMQLSLLHSKI